MTYDLYIGDKAFSSWSLRGWLMFRKFDIPVNEHLVGLYSGTMADDLANLAPARLVPAMRTPDGIVVGESNAMAETLAERHPDAGLWPDAPDARATARWLVSEMCAGFTALRGECPMQLLRAYRDVPMSDAVKADLARIETLFAHARAVSVTTKGPLFGAYCLADVFYTPVAARVIGYGLSVSPATRAYFLELLSDPLVQAWRKDALKVIYEPEPYRLDLPSDAWPV